MNWRASWSTLRVQTQTLAEYIGFFANFGTRDETDHTVSKMETANLCRDCIYFFNPTNPTVGWVMHGNPAATLSLQSLLYYRGGQVFSE
ncbi:MAG: hypothetical protein OET41_11550 [Xanthomonadales bacterium]|nr:hypothetical protein [Xanthomonadales bacterium]